MTELVWDGKYKDGKNLRYRKARYRKFILDLYHGTPITGYAWLHGTKSGRIRPLSC